MTAQKSRATHSRWTGGRQTIASAMKIAIPKTRVYRSSGSICACARPTSGPAAWGGRIKLPGRRKSTKLEAHEECGVVSGQNVIGLTPGQRPSACCQPGIQSLSIHLCLLTDRCTYRKALQHPDSAIKLSSHHDLCRRNTASTTRTRVRLGHLIWVDSQPSILTIAIQMLDSSTSRFPAQKLVTN